MKIFVLLFSLFLSVPAFSSTVSYRATHPIAWMHGLPTGESPGWSSKRWFITEIQEGNFWNAEMDLTDLRTGDTYTYAEDFEQILFQMEAGWEVSKKLSFSVALPVVERFGGILDQPLDDWHIFVGADRFRRNEFPKGKNHWKIQKNGEDTLATDAASGLGMAVLKWKWWFYQPHLTTPKPDFEGMALSFQTRIPLRGARSTLSTGHVEASALFHAGSRVTSWFYIWATAGLTKLTPTPGLEGWPQRQWAQVYEAWMEFPLSDHWDIVAQARYQSPLLDKQHLEFQYDSTEEKYQQAERAASGWNALTAWRGNEALGFRYHFQKQNSFLFLFQEDWAIGDNDGRRNFLYVNGSPDVALVSQLQIAF